jgi:hypothetical protein
MIYTNWMPLAATIGIGPDVFWTMTLRELKIYANAYKQKEKRRYEELDIGAFQYGVYAGKAINACFSKNGKYPEKPFSLTQSENDMSEEQFRRKWEEAFSKSNSAIRSKNG